MNKLTVNLLILALISTGCSSMGSKNSSSYYGHHYFKNAWNYKEYSRVPASDEAKFVSTSQNFNLINFQNVRQEELVFAPSKDLQLPVSVKVSGGASGANCRVGDDTVSIEANKGHTFTAVTGEEVYCSSSPNSGEKSQINVEYLVSKQSLAWEEVNSDYDLLSQLRQNLVDKKISAADEKVLAELLQVVEVSEETFKGNEPSHQVLSVDSDTYFRIHSASGELALSRYRLSKGDTFGPEGMDDRGYKGSNIYKEANKHALVCSLVKGEKAKISDRDKELAFVGGAEYSFVDKEGNVICGLNYTGRNNLAGEVQFKVSKFSISQAIEKIDAILSQNEKTKAEIEKSRNDANLQALTDLSNEFKKHNKEAESQYLKEKLFVENKKAIWIGHVDKTDKLADEIFGKKHAQKLTLQPQYMVVNLYPKKQVIYDEVSGSQEYLDFEVVELSQQMKVKNGKSDGQKVILESNVLKSIDKLATAEKWSDSAENAKRIQQFFVCAGDYKKLTEVTERLAQNTDRIKSNTVVKSLQNVSKSNPADCEVTQKGSKNVVVTRDIERNKFELCYKKVPVSYKTERAKHLVVGYKLVSVKTNYKGEVAGQQIVLEEVSKNISKLPANKILHNYVEYRKGGNYPAEFCLGNRNIYEEVDEDELFEAIRNHSNIASEEPAESDEGSVVEESDTIEEESSGSQAVSQ